MKIGVDLDGVLYDFAGSLKQYLVTHRGYDPDTLPDAKLWTFFESWGFTLDEYLAMAAEGVDAGIVFLHGGADPAGVEVIQDFRDEGHSIHIVTHRTFGKRAVTNTMEWLQREGVEYDTITFSGDKTLLKTDVFIEDNVDNFVALENAGIRSFLRDQPWNEHHRTSYRVSDWYDFYDQITERVSAA